MLDVCIDSHAIRIGPRFAVVFQHLAIVRQMRHPQTSLKHR